MHLAAAWLGLSTQLSQRLSQLTFFQETVAKGYSNCVEKAPKYQAHVQ
jgi:hypothetical protein